jgi:hypothetical protein
MTLRRLNFTWPLALVGCAIVLSVGCAEQAATAKKRRTSGGAPANGGEVIIPTEGGTTGDGGTSGEGSTTGDGGMSTVGGAPPASGACSSVESSAEVVLSAESGTFQGTMSLELWSSIDGAEIRYTTNGQPATDSASSNLYSGTPIQLTMTTRLRAQAFVDGAPVGGEAAAIYVARSIDATHDLPVIVLDSYGSGKLPTTDGQRPYVDVAYLAYDTNGGSVSLGSTPSVASFAAFHVRGNSSAMFDKLSYRLELRDGTGVDRHCPVLGMPDESDWALVAPYADKTLIHNNFAYALGRDLGLQAPRVKLAEVYVNVDNQPLSSDDYQGVYQVVETIKNQKDRVNLKQLNPTKTSPAEISGAYIFVFEWKLTLDQPLECPSGVANCWQYLGVVDPEPIAPEQKDWLTQHLVSFNNALHGGNIADETTGYPAYLELQSFVDFVIITEYTRNLDAYARSQNFYKDRDAKINAGPLWDYDLIAGSGIKPGGSFGGNYANIAIEGWQTDANSARLTGNTSDWFPILINDPTFRSRLVSRWIELRQGILSDGEINARIDGLAAGVSAAADRNFRRWNILTQGKVANIFDTPTDSTWAGQIQTMKAWLQHRAAWLDQQWQ